jgi:PII-like signaling protein
MRVHSGEQTLVRIFVSEGEAWHHQPLWRALVDRLHREGFAGATVLRAIAGFGARSHVHTTAILDLATDLPLVIEIVEDEAGVARLRPILDEMIVHGLVTMEKVEVVQYARRARA